MASETSWRDGCEEGASLYLLSNLLDAEEAVGVRELYREVLEERTGFFSSSESEESAFAPDLAYERASRSFALLSLSIWLISRNSHSNDRKESVNQE